MKRLLALLSILVVVFFASCNNETPSEKIARLEPHLFGADGSVNKEVGIELADAYVAYVKKNINDEVSPDMLFKAIDISMNLNGGNPQKTIKSLIKHGKKVLTPESVVDFLRIQKNELLGGDE